MRILFILCAVVTILQTTLCARGIDDDPNDSTAAKTQNAGSQRVIRTTTREVSNSRNQKPKVKAAEPDVALESVDGEPETNADDNSAESAEPPKTIRGAGKRLAKTASKVTSENAAGLMNGLSGMLKSTSSAFNFFGKFLVDRSKNVKDVARKKFDMVASLSDNAAIGAGHLIDSAKTIGNQGGKTMYSLLKKGTALGVNATKLGGTIAGTPISIAEDVVSTGNRVAKIPSRLSKSVTNGYIKPALDFMGPDSDEIENEMPASGEESPATNNVVPSPQKPVKAGGKVTKK